MNDIKNISIAWLSTVTSVFTAIEARTVITIISAVVLPIVFFAIGKTVDVCLQIHFRRTEAKRDPGGSRSNK
ncbi:MAG: hypothetical protein ABI791_10505 [Acidobacteriota bacterium]